MFLISALMSIFVACTDFNDRFKFHSEQCKETIKATNNRQVSKDISDLLNYKPIYHHTILRRTTKLIRASLPLLHLKGRAPRREAFSLKRFNDELSAHRLAAKPPSYEEGVTSSSLSYTSLDPINSEKEDEEAVSQLVLNKRWGHSRSPCQSSPPMNRDPVVEFAKAIMRVNPSS